MQWQQHQMLPGNFFSVDSITWQAIGSIMALQKRASSLADGRGRYEIVTIGGGAHPAFCHPQLHEHHLIWCGNGISAAMPKHSHWSLGAVGLLC